MPRPIPFTLPPGRWAIGVSGGADSVALARLAVAAATGTAAGRDRLVLAHLDHQLRGVESDADAEFVSRLGDQLGIPTEIGRRDQVELDLLGLRKEARDLDKRNEMSEPIEEKHALDAMAGAVDSSMRNTARSQFRSTAPAVASNAYPATSPPRIAPPNRNANPSARYRAARLAFFADVVQRHHLNGVLLAHHADDQAETVLLRLLRGRGLAGLGGIAVDTTVGGLRIVRPLLDLPRAALRDYLRSIDQPWREDASNAAPDYRRNVVRVLLARHPAWTPALLRLAATSGRLRDRLAARPALGERFAVADLPADPLAAEFAVRQWLLARGSPADRVSPAICQRLIRQARDVTQPPRQHYPGRVLVRRRAKQIDCIDLSTAP